MMLNLQLFSLNASETLTFSERLSEAGLVTLMGMGAVFAVLIILWACIEIMHAIVGIKEEKTPEPKQSVPERAEPPVAVAQAAPEEVAPTAVAGDDGALIAAITAAISAAMADEGYTGGFRVVSFKRASASNRRSRF